MRINFKELLKAMLVAFLVSIVGHMILPGVEFAWVRILGMTAVYFFWPVPILEMDDESSND